MSKYTCLKWKSSKRIIKRDITIYEIISALLILRIFDLNGQY